MAPTNSYNADSIFRAGRSRGRPQASRHVHRQCLPQGPEPPRL